MHKLITIYVVSSQLGFEDDERCVLGGSVEESESKKVENERIMEKIEQ